MGKFKLMAGQFPKGTSSEKQAIFNRQGEELSIYLALVRSGSLKLSDYQALHLAVMMWAAKNQEAEIDFDSSTTLKARVDFEYQAALTTYSDI